MTEEKKLTWLQLMWKNFFLQLFVIAIALLGIEFISRDEFYSETGFYIGISVPILIMIMIGYGAFYKFWKGYCKDVEANNNKKNN